MLGKVRALLRKAESTEFPREAEAFTARAQELIARHNLDAALLAAGAAGASGGSGGPAGEGPGERRVSVGRPYPGPKAMLLHVVAEANRCRSVWHRERGEATVLGFPADLDAVELLYTSLLVQATGAMVRAGAHTDVLGRSRTRSFRHAFLSAYALRIGERLREAAERAVDATAAPGLGLVLASRDEAVARRVAERFPRLRRFRGGGATNADGWAHGRAAADRAALGHTALASDHE